VRRRRLPLAAAVAVALALAGAAGCGGDDEPATPSGEGAEPTTAVAPATSTDSTLATTTTPTAAATAPTTPTATTGVPPGGVTTGEGGESGEGGAGDEEAVRVSVALTLAGGRLAPTTVTVPAFLALEVTITSTGPAATATLPGGATLAIPAGSAATKRLTGLKPGDYAVTAGGGAKTTLHVVSGGDPGP
jgi:hypothetical protein